MEDLSANVRLRPTRIGYLVRPSDRKSVREIMRINACLWGGRFNPIIPIFRNAPKEWRGERFLHMTGQDVAEGYIKFFEPDVYVEAKEGLLEKAGLGKLRKDHFDSPVISLEQFFDREYRNVHVPTFGQSVFDIIEETYQSERRFKLREDFPAIYPKATKDVFSELCVGVYPDNKKTEYIRTSYHHVYRPNLVSSTPEMWLEVFGNKCVTPFSVTNKHFDARRYWHDDPVIYIFDPKSTTDLLDLWNLRIEPSRIIPVPLAWFSDLVEPLRNFIKNNYRPLKNNANGVMHSTTVEVARSIPEDQSRDQFLPLLEGLPQGSWSFKVWRTRIWQVNYLSKGVKQPERIKITASEKSKTVSIKDDGYFHTEFDSISPEFAEIYSGSRSRWVNVLTISAYNDCNAALSLPYNTFDRNWPITHVGKFNIGREGWVFCQDYKDSSQTVPLLKNDEVFSRWFKLQGIQVSLSEPGRIAKQMLESLGGFRGLNLFDDEASIKFVNKLANSIRVRSSADNGETLEEEFSGRAANIEQWQSMISRRRAQGLLHRVSLSKYIEKNVIRVGLETECSHCNANNWHGLDEVSYEIKCSRCLKLYDFPQGGLKKYNQNWKYRVIGPFAVPNYAQGAYASLLTMRFFCKFINREHASSYSTAIDIVSNKKKCEVDFAIWSSDEKWHDAYGEPRLIIGEAKSFAAEGVKEDDLSKLQMAAELMPGSILVVSVLKDEFSDDEIILLKKFVEWAREPVHSEPRHWVILLTGTELFGEYLGSVWKKKGEPFSDFGDYHFTSNFEPLSDATLAIYLGLPPYYKWLGDKEEGKRKRLTSK